MTTEKIIDVNPEDIKVETVTTNAAAPDVYAADIEHTFNIQPASTEQEALIINVLEKMEIAYMKNPKNKTISFSCTEKMASKIQSNIKTNIFFPNVRNVSDNISGFMKNTADVCLHTGTEAASAAIKAATAVGGSVITAGVALGGATITNVSKTAKAIHRDLRYNQDIKDAKTEIKSVWSALCSKLGGGTLSEGGLLRKVK